MNNIILIGFMGCGKSSVGKLLSKVKEYHFIDTDQQIEQKEQRKVSQIFAQDGEDVFRELETSCIEELLQKEISIPIVVSVGGGLVLRDRNQDLLKKLGTIVYLDASAWTIYQRLKTDKTRPLLQGDNPKEKIEALMNSRKAIYENISDIKIDVNFATMDEIVEKIIQQIN